MEGGGEGSKYLTYRLLANREHLQIVTRDTNIGWPNSKIFCNIYSEGTCLHYDRRNAPVRSDHIYDPCYVRWKFRVRTNRVVFDPAK